MSSIKTIVSLAVAVFVLGFSGNLAAGSTPQFGEKVGTNLTKLLQPRLKSSIGTKVNVLGGNLGQGGNIYDSPVNEKRNKLHKKLLDFLNDK